MTNKQIAQIVKLIGSGKSQMSVAKTIGCARSTVQYWLNK